jgi:translocation and assembly module TamB
MVATDVEHRSHGPPPPPGRGGRVALRVALWAAGVLAGLAILIVAAGLVLDTGPGHRLLVGRLAGMDFQGLRLEAGRVEGSLYGRMLLRDVTVRDQQGEVATSPAVVLDWDPRALFGRHVVVNELSSDLVRLERRPILKPTTGKSHMPSLTYTLRRLAVSRLILEPALAGERRVVSILASADLPHGRALVNAEARAEALPGGAGGDVATLKLDAEPKANRLQLAAHVFGPKSGVIDRLLKLDAPSALEVSGRGDWRDWRGRADAAVGGEAVLAANLSASNGRFRATGDARPGRLFKPIARLTAPVVRYDLAAAVRGPLIALQGRAASDVFTAEVSGGVDRDQRLLHQVRVAGALADPSALAAELSGRDLRLGLLLDGPFARPLIDYDFSARSLGYGKMSAENVAAHGRSTRTADGTVQIPVSLTAGRLTGFSPSAAPLTRISLNGPVVIRRDGRVSAGLRLRSGQLDAGLTLAGSQRSRTYAGALNARADAAAVRQFGLGSVLGGATSVSAEFATSPDVTLRVSKVRLTAPLLRVTSLEAAYRADGRIALAGSAVSPTYGPVQLNADGTLKAIRAHLSAPSPKLSVPVTRVQADLTPISDGYRITASGASPYGPLTIDSAIRIRAPLTIAVNRAQFGGVTLTGTVARTAQGPFAGALAVSGDGLNGALRLQGDGAVQAAQLDLRAANAALPLAPPVAVRSGQIAARAVLYPDAPALQARANLAGVQRGGVSLTTLRAQLDYRKGAGRASLAMAGDTGARFQLAADAGLSPTAIRVNGGGSVEGVAFRLAQPAQVTRQGAVWRLAPATVLTSDGRMVLAGTYGQGASLSAQLESVDLKLLRAVRPGLGISGQASGQASLDLPQGRAPSGRLALQLTKLSHTGATAVSEPVDINFLAGLAGSTGDARAVFRQRGAVVGRLQAQAVMPATGDFSQRLRAARINGGLRYNGPVDALTALVPVTGQQLSGPIAIGADIGGPLERPQVRGVVYGRNLEYQNAKYGTHITDITLDGRFVGTRFELVKMTGVTRGGGSVSGSGYADLSAASGWPIDLKLKLDRAQLAQSDQLGARLSGALTLSNSRPKGALISGDLRLEQASYQVARTGGVEVADLKGVHWKGQRLQPIQTASSGPPSQWRLNIRIRAPNQILVRGMGLESEWAADLRVLGDINNPKVVGDVRTVRGSYSFGGRKLALADDSVIHFNGSSPPNPSLDITASADVNNVTATVAVGGYATSPQITFSSTPVMPQDEVLSVLLFGGTSAQISSLQALQLASSMNSLRGGGGGLGALGKLSRASGLENLRFQGANKETGQGVSVGAGKYITNKIYVDVLTDARGYTATQVEVALSRALSLLSQVGTFGSSSVSIRYTHRY